MPCAQSQSMEESVERALAETEAFAGSHPSPVIREALTLLQEARSLMRQAVQAHNVGVATPSGR